MRYNKNKLLLVVTGPTAVGKTSLAIDLAKHLSTEIISCDSRQIYSEMSIGTAVPNKEQLNEVKHHFIQAQSVKHPINASDYGIEAQKKIAELFKHHQTVVVTGGSGLYLDSIIKGIDQIPSPLPQIRAELQKKIYEGKIVELQNELQSVDTDYFKIIDIKNPRRLLRGLEVYYTTGKPLSHFLINTPNTPFKTAMIVLEINRERLYSRIDQRVDAMISEGLIDEVKNLRSFKTSTPLQTVGYQELFEYFDHQISLDNAIEKIKYNTHKYARKQETWFRRYNGAFRINATAQHEILKLVGEITGK